MKRTALVACLVTMTAVAQNTDYPGARWIPANSGNQTASNRPATYPVDYIVIHVTQGSYNGAISWFQNPASRVSAHYVIRSSDGEITQMVREKDIGWHAGNWNYNTWSVGIEHEGWVDQPQWFTTAMYQSSAALVRDICRRQDIPRNRVYIIGHNEVPGATHSDPGPYWNWSYYMQLVQLEALYHSAQYPIQIRPGERIVATIRMLNSGATDWTPTGSSHARLGTANPRDRISPFFTQGDWVSYNRATGVDALTAVNAVGDFSFVLTGPREYGQYSESYQLVRDGITWFGPVATYNILVVPWEKHYDNRHVDATFHGQWRTSEIGNDRYAQDYRWIPVSRGSTAIARWRLNAPIDGWYDVYAWWTAGSNRTASAPYEIVHSDGVLRKSLDQTTNGGRWNLIGRVRLDAGGGSVYLKANGTKPGVVIADAVRIIGPF
ncbi:MAG: N-acetylmuramoyl-L-alanine amidase [Armatimonadetes bacterium]|nr:N-acetylmuramoyl-L-alanine amidase [Armatimonadota bacterium]